MASLAAKIGGFTVMCSAFIIGLVQEAESQEKSWQLENLLGSSCFVISQQPLTAKNSRMEQLNASKHDIPLRECIVQIADKIARGIATSTNAAGSVSTVGNGNIDLPAFISNTLDDQLSNCDPYWSYYQHCDRWEVSFGRFEILPVTMEPESPGRGTKWTARNLIDTTSEIYRKIEFLVIEEVVAFPQVATIPRIHPQPKISIQREAIAPEFEKRQIVCLGLVLRQQLENRLWYQFISAAGNWTGSQLLTIQHRIDQISDGFLAIGRELVSYVDGNQSSELMH